MKLGEITAFCKVTPTEADSVTDPDTEKVEGIKCQVKNRKS